MPRKARIAPPGYVYHVFNQSAGRSTILRNEKDFLTFERIIIDAHEREPLQILAWCLMSNHWHLVVRPTKEGQLSSFVGRLALTHAVRWRVSHSSVGHGPLYRGRYKAFPVQRSEKLLDVIRYVERNPLSAGSVRRAQDWRWSSLYVRENGPEELKQILSPWPVARPTGWTRYVNQTIPPAELDRLETSETRGRPYGDEAWVAKTVAKLGLESTVRPQGRPRKSLAE